MDLLVGFLLSTEGLSVLIQWCLVAVLLRMYWAWV